MGRGFRLDPPTFRWVVGAETNLAWNCLDQHVKQGRGDHAALIGLNELGDRSVYTYGQLLREVERVAAALRGTGIGPGDRITIYMPPMPQAIILMLATVRIGAIHSVVFAGFGAGALSERIRLSGSRVVFSADVTWRKGKAVNLKEITDKALAEAGNSVERVVVGRPGQPPSRTGDRLGDEAVPAPGAARETPGRPGEPSRNGTSAPIEWTTGYKLSPNVMGGRVVEGAGAEPSVFGLVGRSGQLRPKLSAARGSRREADRRSRT